MDNYNKADTWIEVDRIREDPNNPRTIFSIKHIEGLAQSITQEGFINPIECSPDGIILTGACRFRAARLLNWKKVPVRINSSEYSEYERLRHQLAENIHQSGTSMDSMMNPLDTARGYANLLKLKTGIDWVAATESTISRDEIYGHMKEIAEEIGVDPKTVREYLKLLLEPEAVREAIKEGKIPFSRIVEANRAPLEFKDRVKKKVISKDYASKNEVRADVDLLKRLPDLGLANLERKRSKESQNTNRILNGVVRLGLALEAQPLEEININEQSIIKNQLEWIVSKIENYLK